ncbi:MAG: electron transfer flavoprotein alpha subunit [Planctomycetota bacterium]|jgi:electron transfer flavoprotein alpha subunit
MSKVIVYCEHANGQVRRASLEAIGAAKSAGADVIAVLAGEGASAAAATAVGASKAVCLTGPTEFSSDATASAAADVCKAEGAQGFLAAATYRGKDIAPRVAAHLDVTPFADCIELTANGDSFHIKRPWLAGKALATMGTSADFIVATTRLNVFDASEGGAPGEIAEHAITAEAKAKVTGIEAKASSKLDVKEAPVVISGGRGLQEAEHFGMLEDLADAFGNAAVGASRAVVDLGWRPHGEQVGQTGKTVAPQLYIAVAISGAIQHLAGMRTSGTIVAINKDADAPIFKVADYGIVGDAFEIVPKLTEAIKAAKG